MSSPSEKSLPKTLIVGSGPVATALAGALALADVPVIGLWGRTPERVAEAARVAGVPAYSSTNPDPIGRAELFLLAVRDDAIVEVADALLATGLVTSDHIFLHCSGAFSAEHVFGHIADKIGGCALLHPLCSIVDPRRAMAMFQTSCFGVQGDAKGRAAAETLCAALGGEMVALRASQMAGYHAAAAIASNYVVALLDASTRLLEAEGIDSPALRRALVSLAAGSVDNVKTQGLPDALTGPIRRGDRQSVAQHLTSIDEKLPALSSLYRAMGRWTLEMSERCGSADSFQLLEIKRLLDAGTQSDEPPSKS